MTSMSVWSEEMIAEAIALLRAHRFAIEEWSVLSRSNRLVLALEPCELIAKVVKIDSAPRLTLELAVAAHVARAKGPSPAPASLRVYSSATVAASLWERLTILNEPTGAIVCRAYEDLRRCLDSFTGALPDFRAAIDGARHLVAESDLPSASSQDAAILRDVFAACCSSLNAFEWTDRVLHGDAHTGNVALTSTGACWLEFESACAGPLEWDLCTLPEGACNWPHDRDLLRRLKLIRRACVVVWCAARENPAAPEREAIAHHLQVLRAEAHCESSPIQQLKRI